MIRRAFGALLFAMAAAVMAVPAGVWAAEETAGKPASSQPDRSDEEDMRKPLKPEDKPKVLGEAIEQWRTKEYRKASINLTRLINNSKKDELESLSETAQKDAQMPLADLAAEVHLENAREQSKTGALILRYVTSYENEPLVKKIDEAYKKATTEAFVPPPASRPAGKTVADGKTDEKAEGSPPDAPEANLTPLMISAYMNNPKSFSDRPSQPEECTAFARHISYAISLLDAKNRLDPSLRTDKEAKKKIAEEKKQLDELRRVVLTSAHMTPAMRERQEQIRKLQEERKNKRSPSSPRSSSPKRSELDRRFRQGAGAAGSAR